MKNIVLILSILVSLNGFSQTTNWELYKNVDGVNIYTKLVECDEPSIPGQKAYILKVENTTTQDLQIEWDASYWFNDVQVMSGVAEGENHFVLNVKNMNSIEGECATPRGALYFFVDFTVFDSETKLTNFELENIKVTREKN